MAKKAKQVKGGKTAISAASATAKSLIRAKGVSPVHVKTAGLVLDTENALLLARNLLMVALDTTVSGTIFVTGHTIDNSVTVIRQRK